MIPPIIVHETDMYESIDITINIGYVYEKGNVSGISHFIEHMIAHDVLFKEMTNAHTGICGTMYVIKFDIDSSKLQMVLRLIFNEFGKKIQDKSFSRVFENEKKVITNELKEYGYSDIELFALCDDFIKAEYCSESVGSRSTIHGFTPRMCADWWKMFYGSNNAVIHVTGPVARAHAKAKMLEALMTKEEYRETDMHVIGRIKQSIYTDARIIHERSTNEYFRFGFAMLSHDLPQIIGVCIVGFSLSYNMKFNDLFIRALSPKRYRDQQQFADSVVESMKKIRKLTVTKEGFKYAEKHLLDFQDHILLSAVALFGKPLTTKDIQEAASRVDFKRVADELRVLVLVPIGLSPEPVKWMLREALRMD